MPRITLDAAQWFRGASTSDELLDGGHSPDDKGISLFVTPGVLRPGPRDIGTGSIYQSQGAIGFTTAKALVSPGASLALTSNASDDGRVLEMVPTSSSGYTTLYGPDTGRDYTAGFSDIIRYKSGVYYTSKTDIALASDFDWWSATEGETLLNGNVVHPLLEYGDIMYVADGRYIHSWDGTTSTYNALDLPADYEIYCMAVFNNVIVIVAEYFQGNQAGERYGRTKIFTWDGFSPSWIDETEVREHIDTLFPFAGTLYVTTKDYFGYFNGTAIVPLRALTSQVRKYQITAVKDGILMVQGDSILAYRTPIAGRQRFFSYPFKSEVGTLTAIFSFYGSRVHLAASATSIFLTDIDAASDGGDYARSFKENRLPLGDYAYIRKFTYELQNAIASGDTLTMSYVNSNGDTVALGTINNTDHNGRREVVIDVENDLPTYMVQPKYTWTDGQNGIRRVHIDYEFCEDRPTK